MDFKSEQFYLPTSESQKNYFYGRPEALLQVNPNGILPSGTYRVIDGELYRVVAGVPPKYNDPTAQYTPLRWC